MTNGGRSDPEKITPANRHFREISVPTVPTDEPVFSIKAMSEAGRACEASRILGGWRTPVKVARQRPKRPGVAAPVFCDSSDFSRPII